MADSPFCITEPGWQAGWAEGWEEGWEEGLESGYERHQVEIIRALVGDGRYSLTQIAALLKVAEPYVRKISGRKKTSRRKHANDGN